MILISSKYIPVAAFLIYCSRCLEDSIIFILGYCYSWHYNKVWKVNLTWDKLKTDLIECMNIGNLEPGLLAGEGGWVANGPSCRTK